MAKFAIRIPTRVKHLEMKQRTVVTHKDKTTDKITSEVIPLGWYVHFEGSYESLCVGDEKPHGLEVGDEVDIIIIPRKNVLP